MGVLQRLMVMMMLTGFLSACGLYNVKEINTAGLQGPVREVSAGEVQIVPDDPVFGTGLMEDKFIWNGDYQVALAKLPGALINEMLAYTYAWHHGVAFNKRTGQSYRVQSIYSGTKGGFADIPCGRYLDVIIEGLPTVDPDVFVIIGNTRGDRWFDLRGNPVAFTQQDYLSGNWKIVAAMGTPLNKAFAVYQHNDLTEFKAQIRSWASIGRYDIVDVGDSSKRWFLITPYSAPEGGTDIIKELAKINSKYSALDKVMAAADGIVVSSSPEVTALSMAIAAIKIPFIKEHKADELDMSTMAERLDAETRSINGCVAEIKYVPVPVSASSAGLYQR
ncbi:MAG: hypothetical protein PHT88_00085 [Candidatus Moranbacteria bacterium]|nr:hypothetical protein [Candidatus Moranbacteria bacterium]